MRSRNMLIFLGVLFLCFTINISDVYAHPGRTDASGCHTCKTNCSSWGLYEGEYHCHDGKTYTNSKGQTFNSNGAMIPSNNNSTTNGTTNNSSNNTNSSNNNTQVVQKSSDNSIKEIKVNGDIININDMSYKTFRSQANIDVVLNDSKASAEYDKNIDLILGENIIKINVKAENGNNKEYVVNITMEKKLSNNKNIKIMVDNEEVKFELYKNETLTVSSNDNKIDITYELEDENAKVEISGNNDLKVGKNEIVITVFAENGETQEYTLIVKKYSEGTEIAGTVLVFGMLGGTVYGSYYFIKKIRKK